MTRLAYYNFKDKELESIDMEIEETENKLNKLHTKRRKYVDNKRCDHLYELSGYGSFDRVGADKINVEIIRCVKCGEISKVIDRQKEDLDKMIINVGDKVKVVDNDYEVDIIEGKIYEVMETDINMGLICIENEQGFLQSISIEQVEKVG